jgi:hypothetical protein
VLLVIPLKLPGKLVTENQNNESDILGLAWAHPFVPPKNNPFYQQVPDLRLDLLPHLGGALLQWPY